MNKLGLGKTCHMQQQLLHMIFIFGDGNYILVIKGVFPFSSQLQLKLGRDIPKGLKFHELFEFIPNFA